MDCNSIPLIIPAYEPDIRFVKLAEELRDSDIENIIVVNDGSGSAFQECFNSVQDILGTKCTLLTHENNQGKGAALKTAFTYVLEHFQSVIGVVTADSDGQHDVSSIQSIQRALYNDKDKLILGVRQIAGKDIPLKSRFGNTVTCAVFRYISGVSISDTQTGLRGIPISYLDRLLEIKSNRFEFEMKMLIDGVGRYEIVEVPIRTIYDSNENHQTHFKPITDSVKIYSVLGASFFRFLFSSLSSCLIDLVLFHVFCGIFRDNKYYIIYSTVLARVISASYNCLFNYKIVFASKTKVKSAIARYVMLAAIQMMTSAILVSAGVAMLGGTGELVVKILVDTMLFFISYKVQQKYVY